MEPGLLVLLAFAGVLAGFVDSIVGGGGVVTLPALLASGMPPHLAVGTNKVVGTGASGVASWQYARHGFVVRRVALLGAPLATAASIVGAATILRLPEEFILVSVSLVILAMVLWVLARPKFGKGSASPALLPRLSLVVVTLAVVIGFYDGLLGPGTGTFLLFGFVAFTGMPFLQATANGRVLNFGSNVGALVYFALVGNVDWTVGLVMAAGTVTGSYVGSRSNIRTGAKWVRPLFVVIAVALLARIIWDLA